MTPVNDDSLHGGQEARIESPNDTIGLVTLADAVKKTLELAVGCSFPYVSTKPDKEIVSKMIYIVSCGSVT